MGPGPSTGPGQGAGQCLSDRLASDGILILAGGFQGGNGLGAADAAQGPGDRGAEGWIGFREPGDQSRDRPDFPALAESLLQGFDTLTRLSELDRRQSH